MWHPRPRLARAPRLFLVAATLVAACTSAPAATPSADPAHDKLAQIKARGTLVLPTDPAYPPSSFAVEGAARSAGTRCEVNQMTRAEMDGYDVSVGNLIADAIGVEPCYVVPTWTEMIAGHWADRWDIAFASIGVTQERMPGLYFTKPYIGRPSAVGPGRLHGTPDERSQRQADRRLHRVLGGPVPPEAADRAGHDHRLQGRRRQDRRLCRRGGGPPGRRGRQARRLPVRGHGRPGAHRQGRQDPRHRTGRLHRDPGRGHRQDVGTGRQVALRLRQSDPRRPVHGRDPQGTVDEVLQRTTMRRRRRRSTRRRSARTSAETSTCNER